MFMCAEDVRHMHIHTIYTTYIHAICLCVQRACGTCIYIPYTPHIYIYMPYVYVRRGRATHAYTYHISHIYIYMPYVSL